MNNETKKGRGGARANSGMKSSGIETVTVRIDKRLLNVVTIIKADFKNGKSLDDIIGANKPKNDDAELLRKNTALNNVNKHLCSELENEKKARADDVKQLNGRIEQLQRLVDIAQSALRLSQAAHTEDTTQGGLDEKLRKRLVQFCHPDKYQDERSKAIAVELVQELNKLGG